MFSQNNFNFIEMFFEWTDEGPSNTAKRWMVRWPLIRGDIIFDPLRNMEEVVTWSICMPFRFWSTRIDDNVTQLVRNFAFDPPSTVRTGSKASFRTNWGTWPIILKRHAYASRDLSPTYSELDQKEYSLQKHNFIHLCGRLSRYCRLRAFRIFKRIISKT